MGLLKCVDCGHMVSDRARTCPQCGCPVEFTINEYELIRQEYDIVIHPKYGRGRIIDIDQTCITILFENTEERKKFLKTAVMPMLKFLNEGYRQELLKKEEKTNEAHIQEQIENKIDAFWDSVEDWKKSNWKHADYVKIFWEYNGEYKEKHS